MFGEDDKKKGGALALILGGGPEEEEGSDGIDAVRAFFKAGAKQEWSKALDALKAAQDYLDSQEDKEEESEDASSEEGEDDGELSF